MRYNYFAKSLTGEEKFGTAEAKDVHQLANDLKSQGLVLVRIEEEKQKGFKKEFSIPFLDKVSLTDKLMFTRNLQVMIAAGLPLPRALETLSLQAKSKKFKKALLDIKEDISKGGNFSSSLAKHPDIFSELFQNMIKVGEESGTSEEVLRNLADQLEQEHEMKSKIMGALMYPAVIICAMIGIGIMMLIMVVPKLAETFKELGTELPITTKLVMGLGTFMSQKWYLVILIIIILILVFRAVVKTKKGKIVVDSISLKIPIISPLVKKINTATTARTLSSLTASAVPIVRSLEIVAGTLGNVHYKSAIMASAEKVKKGEKLSDSLSVYDNLYPQIVFQMIRVGEETGETAKILLKLAEFFEDEVGNSTKNLASVIEPILMLIIGGVVGFFAISMVQPMYSMLGAIK